MGGAMALHYGYRHCTDLGGVFGLSCFLNNKSTVFDVSSRSGCMQTKFWNRVQYSAVQSIINSHQLFR